MTLVILVGLFFFAYGAIVLTTLISVQTAIWLCAAVTVVWSIGLVIIAFKARSQNLGVHTPQRKSWLRYKGGRCHG